MNVADIMKEAVCIEPDESLETAAIKLKDYNVGCLLVCEADKVIGIITDRDVLMRGTANNRSPKQTKVREVMSSEPLCCNESDLVEQVAAVMADNHVHRLPVLNAQQMLVGVISLTDLGASASQRRPYEIVFYKDMVNSSGQHFQVEKRRIVSGPGSSKEQAIAAAIRFVEAEEQSTWRTFADGYNVVEVQGGQGKNKETVERTSDKEDRIRSRAYEIWETENCPVGAQDAHWQKATVQIEAEDVATS